MNDGLYIPGENPFCTRRIRPGSLSYQFPPDENWETVLKQLRDAAGWGEIIGPHGSGKSTLLSGLIPLLQAEGWQVQRIDLHDGDRRLPIVLRQMPDMNVPYMIIIDGYEQLGHLSRFQLKRHCRQRGWGLIVTAHQPTGLPKLFNTATTIELANRVVEELLNNSEYAASQQDIADCYTRHKGNLREMLFDLYDLFEQRPTTPLRQER
jgi:hypothetical protein